MIGSTYIHDGNYTCLANNPPDQFHMDPSPPASLLACLLDDTDIWTATIVAFTIVIVLISIYHVQPSGPAYCMSWTPLHSPHTLSLYHVQRPRTNPVWPTSARAPPARPFHPPSGANKPERSARQLSILDLEVC
ncbi:uncharacterized protein BO95DRAFT_62671 [Aspergillus brunneoviolaceus CBS 621.78]|uniref:Uncharacterized protein n=1 Tax=Aspergillus brunneoviolaceus CBS 621.78 TaxID=1450534 RepID=A0ACD1GG57_9EURO|nr:hypothetical protein BO95DRAFT_62671 [Aspergillus brunneoviolaceus CBS 621.78]RAH48299.1 hypothetical protein BO95DRAFT_62671 [Aspergillus brunneoviolaceus CBS 621.78]